MTLLESLLDAITRLEGDALVMHVGEKPYVVTTSAAMNEYRGPVAWGQVELSSRVLTSEAVLGMVAQVLPPEQRQSLEEFGAVEHELPVPEGSTEHFTVVAARGGDDVWLELRRKPKIEPQVEEPVADAPVEETPAAIEHPAAEAPIHANDAPVEPVEAPIEHVAVHAGTAADAVAPAEPVSAAPVEEAPADEVPFEIVPEVAQLAPSESDVDALLAASAAALLADVPSAAAAPLVETTEVEMVVDAADLTPAEPAVVESAEVPVEEIAIELSVLTVEAEAVPTETGTETIPEPQPVALAPEPIASQPEAVGVEPEPMPEPEPIVALSEPAAAAAEPASIQPAVAVPEAVAAMPEPEPVMHVEPEPVAAAPAEPPAVPVTTVEASQPPAAATLVASRDEDEQDREPRGVVVPIVRMPVRKEPPAAGAGQSFSVEELLRVAAARGSLTVYVVAQSQPLTRAYGEISALAIGSGGPLSEADVNRLVLDLAPPAARDAWQRGAPAEWTCDVEDVGRVRCLTFHDHRGPGLIFRMIPPRAISADQLGLTPAVQALCNQSDGLVLVTGPRASGKSTLMSSFVDLINRTRSDHVVTIESQIGFVHESRRSFVSQREVRGDADAVASAVRSALHEDPDVLLIEDLRSPDVAIAALEAAESGRLIFASLPAASAVAAIDRLLELFPADRRVQAQSSLAGALRGVVAQVLLRRSRGGRVAVREILLNTPQVASLIDEGKTGRLPLAMANGRRHGMMPLNDALTAFVRDGTVHVTDAYLKAYDKQGLLAGLERDGVDTSFAERLA